MGNGNWNRQGRRSGGYRKHRIIVPLPQFGFPDDLPSDEVKLACPICDKVTPPYDADCDGCCALRKLVADGKIVP